MLCSEKYSSEIKSTEINQINRMDENTVEDNSWRNPVNFPLYTLNKMYILHPDINRMDHIHDNIYVSNWFCSINEQLLVQNNIKHIVCLNNQWRKSISNIKMYNKLGIKHTFVNFADDGVSSLSELSKTTNGLLNQKENVLVHCSMGISRSPSVIACYLKMKSNMSMNEILELLLLKRKELNINEGFIKQLKALD